MTRPINTQDGAAGCFINYAGRQAAVYRSSTLGIEVHVSGNHLMGTLLALATSLLHERS